MKDYLFITEDGQSFRKEVEGEPTIVLVDRNDDSMSQVDFTGIDWPFTHVQFQRYFHLHFGTMYIEALDDVSSAFDKYLAQRN